MFKCILICAAFPFRSMLGHEQLHRMAPPVTTFHDKPEEAMSLAVAEVVKGNKSPSWETYLREVQSMTTWCPATGVVYVDGTAVGVVTSAEKEEDRREPVLNLQGT